MVNHSPGMAATEAWPVLTAIPASSEVASSNKNLTVRSRAKRGVSKGGQHDERSTRSLRLHSAMRRRQLLCRLGKTRIGEAFVRAQQRHLWRLHVETPARRTHLVRTFSRHHGRDRCRASDQGLVTRKKGGADARR